MNSNRIDEETATRRTVLRGALMIGCGVLLPAVLASCGSRNGESRVSNTPPTASGAATEAAPTAAPTATKVSQVSVQYQQQPKGDQSCSGCQHFIPESNTCMLVEGPINPNGWCTLWARKS